MSRILVYKAFFGNEYTGTDSTINQAGGVDFVFISNLSNIKVPDYFKNVKKPINNNPIFSNRQYKILAEDEILADYDFTVYLDDNIIIKTDLLHDLVPRWLEKHSLAMFKHPIRSCIYHEAHAVIMLRKDKPMSVLKQIVGHKRNGFPSQYGLGECSILVRNNRSFKQKAFNKLWWDLFVAGSSRDQLSFDYARWVLQLPVNYLQGSVDNNAWFKRVRPTSGYRRAHFSQMQEIQRRLLISRLARPIWNWLQCGYRSR